MVHWRQMGTLLAPFSRLYSVPGRSDWTGRLPAGTPMIGGPGSGGPRGEEFPWERACIAVKVYRPGTKSRSISLSDVAAIQLSTAPQEDSPL